MFNALPNFPIKMFPPPAIVPTETHTKNQAVWKDKSVRVLKYVDDVIQVDKVNMDTVLRLPGGVRRKEVVRTENLFRSINGVL